MSTIMNDNTIRTIAHDAYTGCGATDNPIGKILGAPK